MLVLVLLVTVTVPAVTEDCFEDLPNNESYDNCATCYQTFANALINTADNKYRLSRAFFPIDDAPSVQVKVTYQTNVTVPRSKVYFWIVGAFFIFQPLDVFLYRSLLFSLPIYRSESLTIILPDTCFDNEEFFEFATQRVSLWHI